MRNKVAKKLKLQVALKMFVGGDVTKEMVLNDRKLVYRNRDFKRVYRARKKNYNRLKQCPLTYYP